jgi:hypothetical protein
MSNHLESDAVEPRQESEDFAELETIGDIVTRYLAQRGMLREGEATALPMEPHPATPQFAREPAACA